MAARAVHLLGLRTTEAADLVPPGPANPSGFWESRRMNRHNEYLLRCVGSTWCHPPPTDDFVGALSPYGSILTSRAEFFRVHHSAQWVWKEPRLCITLPWWRKALPEIRLAVLMVRNPLECASSSTAALGLDLDWGLALWESHTHRAISALAGMPALVSTYQTVRDSPMEWCDQLASTLTVMNVNLSATWRADLRDFVTANRYAFAEGWQRRVPLELVDHWTQLRRLEGMHWAFQPPPIPPESSWTRQVLAQRRLAAASTYLKELRQRT
jgi:hypothetical protein